MSKHYLSGTFISIALAGLTACGGATSPQMPSTSEAEIVVPDLDAALNGGATTDSVTVNPDLVPAITDPSITEAVVEEIPTTNVLVETSDGTDVMLLAGAADVGCEAGAALFRSTMLELINASRIQARMCGNELHQPVPVVQWNDNLAVAAANHGRDMAANNFFSHTGSDGLGVSERATAAGYNWRAIGENIAGGQRDQAEVHQGWLDSEGHCENIMSDWFTEVGAACISDPDSNLGTYWAVVFGDHK